MLNWFSTFPPVRSGDTWISIGMGFEILFLELCGVVAIQPLLSPMELLGAFRKLNRDKV